MESVSKAGHREENQGWLEHKEELAAEIQEIRGKPSRPYVFWAVLLVILALGATLLAFLVNRKEVSGPTAQLQLVWTALGIIFAAAATFPITRAMSRPNSVLAGPVRRNRDAASRIRNDIADLIETLDRATATDSAEARDAYLTELRKQITKVAIAAYNDVDQWFVLEQACKETLSDLKDHLDDYVSNLEDRARLLLASRGSNQQADTIETLLISKVVYGDDYIQEWIDSQAGSS
jgi:hypothetical protein